VLLAAGLADLLDVAVQPHHPAALSGRLLDRQGWSS
jgi:hypothetical protein